MPSGGSAILIVAGEKLDSNWHDKEAADKHLLHLRSLYPKRDYSLKDFLAHISSSNPDMTVKDWHKGIGWSIWFRIQDILEPYPYNEAV